jgi:hypothetical protein
MKKGTRQWRTLSRALLVSAMLVGVPHAALAAQDVQVQTRTGWDGVYKNDNWTQVQVTVENKGGDLKARLAVTPDELSPGELFVGTYEKEIVVPKGTVKTYTLQVPGYLLNSTCDVKLYAEDGAEILSHTIIPGTGLTSGQGLLIGGIMAKQDDLNLFSLLPQAASGGKVQIRQLHQDMLPDTPSLLDSLDLLAVNHAPQEKLTEEQVRAIRDWVEHGGTLLLSGGANYNGGASLFGDLSPVQVSGTGEATDLAGLGSYAGSKPTADRLQISVGTPKQGAKVLVQAGQVPLLAMQDVGAGHVVYAAYDLSAEPLASWQGNKELWQNVLSTAMPPAALVPNQQGGHAFSKHDAEGNVLHASTMFRNLTPSLVASVAVFGGYVLLVGPGLFFALRRKGKREWGWALIPAVALTVAVGIYAVGTGQRSGGALGQFTAYVDLLSEKTARVEGAGSFIVTKGGDYEVELAPGALAYATRESNSGYGGGSNSFTVSQNGDQMKVAFANVDYWSTRSAYVHDYLKDQGQITSDLRLDKAGRLTGTVTNASKFDLEHTTILVGNQTVDVGALKPGATAKVEKSIQSANAINPGDSNSLLMDSIAPYDSSRPGVSDSEQERQLLQYAINPAVMGPDMLQLYAISKTPLGLYQIKGVQMRDDLSLSLVHQNLKLNLEDGSVMPPGMIVPKVTATQGNFGYDNQGINLQTGLVELEYNLQQDANHGLKKVTTDLDKAIYAMFDKQLFNWQKNDWEAVGKENTPNMSGDVLKQFVSPGGTLKMRLKSASLTGQYVPYPKVGFEGKVSK